MSTFPLEFDEELGVFTWKGKADLYRDSGQEVMRELHKWHGMAGSHAKSARERFEAWALSDCWNPDELTRYIVPDPEPGKPDWDYLEREVGWMWVAWQAAETASSARLSKACELLKDAHRLVANDAHAISFQTMGQYRSALLKALREAIEEVGHE